MATGRASAAVDGAHPCLSGGRWSSPVPQRRLVELNRATAAVGGAQPDADHLN